MVLVQEAAGPLAVPREGVVDADEPSGSKHLLPEHVWPRTYLNFEVLVVPLARYAVLHVLSVVEPGPDAPVKVQVVGVPNVVAVERLRRPVILPHAKHAGLQNIGLPRGVLVPVRQQVVRLAAVRAHILYAKEGRHFHGAEPAIFIPFVLHAPGAILLIVDKAVVQMLANSDVHGYFVVNLVVVG